MPADTVKADSSNFRLKPTVRNTILIILGYLATLIILGRTIASNISYADITSSSDAVLRAVVIPVGIGSILLTGLAIWSGWWSEIWKKNKIKGHKWFIIIPIIIFIGLVLKIIGGDVAEFDSTFIIYAVIATMLVGYSEELLARGMAVVGLRESGWNEARVMIGSSLLFAAAHFMNLLGGQSLQATMGQVSATFIIGLMLYISMRSTGFIIVSMTLHFLWDFGVMTATFGGKFSDSLNFDVSILSKPTKIGLLLVTLAQLLTIVALLIIAIQSRKAGKKKSKEVKA